MTTRLDLALHELADAAGDASAFGDPELVGTTTTVQRLAASVRRRRATRRVGTAAVAASAVGAVALGGPRLTSELTPASGAAPGTCRSAVGVLPMVPGTFGLQLGTTQDDVSALSGGGGESLGTWQGESATVEAQRVVDGVDAPTTLEEEPFDLVVAQDGVVVSSTPAKVPAVEVTTQSLRAHTPSFEVVGEGGGTAWYSLDADDRLTLGWTVLVDVTSCLTGDRLPPGTYDVWATQESDGVVRRTAGPWTVSTVAKPGRVTGLPDDFPSDVPLVPGRLVAAHRHGDGWAAEIVTPGDDRAQLAMTLLAQAALPSGEDDGVVLDEDGVFRATVPYVLDADGVRLPGWAAKAMASHTPDGEESLVYVLRPRS